MVNGFFVFLSACTRSSGDPLSGKPRISNAEVSGFAELSNRWPLSKVMGINGA